MALQGIVRLKRVAGNRQANENEGSRNKMGAGGERDRKERERELNKMESCAVSLAFKLTFSHIFLYGCAASTAVSAQARRLTSTMRQSRMAMVKRWPSRYTRPAFSSSR